MSYKRNKVGDWKAWTPTGTWSTNTTYSGYYRENGESLEMRVNIITSGAPTSAGLEINLPPGYAINSTITHGSDSFAVPIGECNILDAGTAGFTGIVRVGSSLTQMWIAVGTAGGTYTSYTNVTQAIPMTWATSDQLWAIVSVPFNRV